MIAISKIVKIGRLILLSLHLQSTTFIVLDSNLEVSSAISYRPPPCLAILFIVYTVSYFTNATKCMCLEKRSDKNGGHKILVFFGT